MIFTNQFDFHLPADLIAQHPVFPRDRCRLMVIDRKSQTTGHQIFSDLGRFLHKGDLLIFNDSRVIPARFYTVKNPTGGRVEILYLHRNRELWVCCLNHSRSVRVGTILSLPENQRISWQVMEREQAWWFLQPSFSIEEEKEIFSLYGHTPTPPYIKTPGIRLEDYQTVYARYDGSVAAPTAGLHFTQSFIEKLQGDGMGVASLTLHVGPGTFFPVKTQTIEEHRMHSERYELNQITAETIQKIKKRGGRVVAVGTTVVRVLESIFQRLGKIGEAEGETDIFIYPGFQFQVIDAMITNFHTPRSTLFMLVCAFGGTDLMKKAYIEAIDRRYRFYSFGDATLIV